jgi:hypothetical protein
MARQEPPHASLGGSRGYDPVHRQDAIDLAAAGGTPTPSRWSLARWMQNGLPRLRQTGNAPAANLRGEHQFLLVVFRLVHPKASADEIITFIATHSSNGKRYTRSDISKREMELGLTRKRGSTTALQAYTPRNLLRRHHFRTLAHPYGVLGTSRALLIDSDECGLWFEKNICKYGKAVSNVRVRAPGIYGHGDKWTLIMAVDCAGRRWVRLTKEAGTGVAAFDQFVAAIVASLPSPATGGAQRTFMWDNLWAHLNGQVHNTVTSAGHRVLARPAYRPVDGPIEYVFNSLQGNISRRIGEIQDDVSFVRVITDIITNLTGFDAYFVNCGYA